jgi:hypothetical protein
MGFGIFDFRFSIWQTVGLRPRNDWALPRQLGFVEERFSRGDSDAEGFGERVGGFSHETMRRRGSAQSNIETRKSPSPASAAGIFNPKTT